MESYWALAEELDLPVGIHIGTDRLAPSTWERPATTRGCTALTIEDVLVKHPKRRVYIMHAGYPMVDDL